MQSRIKVGLVGVTGYTGQELLRLLCAHQGFELSRVTSRQKSGQKVQDIFPQFTGLDLGRMDISPPEPESLARECSLIFMAVPHGTAMEMVPALLEQGLQIVDFSADFRLKSAAVYKKWYALEHSRPDLLQQAVYGLPELYASKIKQASLVANPGCYPTSVLLGLMPGLSRGLLRPEQIVIDSKSGTSGAGRSLKTDMLFCEVHNDFRAYSLTKHRHTPEIEQELTLLAGQEMQVSFNPHLLPVDRGILTSIYCRLAPGVDEESIRQAYEKDYALQPWVRVLPRDVLPRLSWVRGTMYCDLGLVLDLRLQRLIIISAIDNLCRGASGQALANANLMCGLEPDLGLVPAPFTP